MLLLAAPEVFYITAHYANYPAILINLEKVNWDTMPGILENAWRLVVPPKLLKEYQTSLA